MDIFVNFPNIFTRERERERDRDRERERGSYQKLTRNPTQTANPTRTYLQFPATLSVEGGTNLKLEDWP